MATQIAIDTSINRMCPEPPAKAKWREVITTKILHGKWFLTCSENARPYLRTKVGRVSQEHFPTSEDNKIRHIYKQYDNLYSLRPEIEFESVDVIYNKDSINTTKFAIVLLTEWSKYLKVGGRIVVSFEKNRILDSRKILRIYEQFLSQKMLLVNCEDKDGQCSCIFEKKEKSLIEGDSADKWTFGVITVGKRNEWVRKYIESIRSQKIPHYEIIIVGTWTDEQTTGKDIKYIPFSEKDDRGWITKKKNIIFENARYNNVLVLHDRFFLDKDWYNCIKKYGNYWDGIFFPIIDKTEQEYVHWSVWGHGLLPIGYADIKDWGEDYYCGGTFMAIKKNIWQKVKLDEKRFFNEQEDSEYGLRFTKNGYVIRANQSSKLHTFATYFYDAPIYEFNNQKLGKPKEYRSKRWILLQRMIDVPARVFGLRFSIFRRKAIAIFKKIKPGRGEDPGGKRV